MNGIRLDWEDGFSVCTKCVERALGIYSAGIIPFYRRETLSVTRETLEHASRKPFHRLIIMYFYAAAQNGAKPHETVHTTQQPNDKTRSFDLNRDLIRRYTL